MDKVLLWDELCRSGDPGNTNPQAERETGLNGGERRSDLPDTSSGPGETVTRIGIKCASFNTNHGQEAVWTYDEGENDSLDLLGRHFDL